MKSILYLILLLLFSGCGRPCHDYAVMGPDEFVMDSYQIRQGKTAILQMEGIEVLELPCDAMDEYKDMITEDDILTISIYHPTRKDLMEAFEYINKVCEGFKVVNGCVDIPDMGFVEVADLTLIEAKEKLQGLFREQIKDLDVFICYKDRLARKIDMIGLVTTPTVPVDGKIRLYEALAKARIPPGANLFMSYVVRDGFPLDLDLHKLINEGDMSQNIVMKGGDKVFIASATDCKAMLMGELAVPQPVNLPYGFISLREALVTAGGIPFTGDKDNIQVIRGNLADPKIYVLSWQHIIHLPNDSLLLMPGDTVYVSAKPITEWNRFIGQLLPSFSGTTAAFEVYSLVR
jgi:polysaccharide biosynthesis/export protein